MVAERESIEAPAFLRAPDPGHQRKCVAATSKPAAGDAELLPAELQHAAVLEPLSVKPAIEIGVFVTRGDIDPGVWIGVVDAPGAHVYPQLAGTALDAQVLERPQLNGREVEDAASARIEIVDLQTVVENSDATEVPVVHRGLGCCQPPRPERRHSRNPVEQIDKRE